MNPITPGAALDALSAGAKDTAKSVIADAYDGEKSEVSEPESRKLRPSPEAPAEPVKARIGGRTFAWLQRAPAFIKAARTFIQRQRRIVLGGVLVLVAAVFVFLRRSVEGAAWVVEIVAKLVSARSWILAHPQALPEVLGVVCLLVALALWLPLRRAERSQGLTPDNRFDRENEARKILARIIGGALVFAGLDYTLQTFSLQQRTLSVQQNTLNVLQNTFDLERQGQITDRFTKAIDQLGAVEMGPDGKPIINLEVRLGGIYALERIARDSPADHWTIIEVLSTYVRENSRATNYARSKADGHSSLRADIQAILTVIGRRDIKNDPHNRYIGLAHSYLRGADLRGAHLTGACLISADLSGADLFGAHLTGAHLTGSDLSGAELSGAHLTGAYLSGSDLSGAELSGAHLNGADLIGAELSGADLIGADLTRADLFGAHLTRADLIGADLTRADLRGADLREVHGVSQGQLDEARGDKNSKLHEGNGLTRPPSWQ